MTNSTAKYDSQISRSILAGIGDNNTNTVNIQFQPGQPMPYMLPQDIGDFTGREDYIAQIEAILDLGKIVTIPGMSGVGKSAVAIRVAYRLKNRYPDGQLYVNLHGQTPQSAVETKTVLIRFLRALTGQDEFQMAADFDGLVAQYRSALADKRALIILDNARDEAQIRDLLTCSANCAVLVTSRSRLTGLPGAVLIDLEPMVVGIDGELGDAELLFQAILQDGNRVQTELAEARKIVGLCGGLPIAIRITAATLNQKIWAKKSLQAYAQELDTEITRLDKLDNENVEKAIPGQGSVRASFSLSHKLLAEEDQQLFCWAGSLPGVNFGAEVLVSVMHWEESEIKAGLKRLLEAQVLELRGDDRFGWHDLMRLFAKEQLKNSERKTVLGLSLTWYCERARGWGSSLDSAHCRQLAQQLAAKDHTAETKKTVDEWEQDIKIIALNWFATEQDNWIDIIKDLTQIPRSSDAINLAANLVPFFDSRGIWSCWGETHEMVKNCAEKAGDLPGVALTLNNFGNLYQKQGNLDQAINHYRKAGDIFHQLGDENEVAQTFNNLGNVLEKQGNFTGSTYCHEKSLEISRRLKDERRMAQILNDLASTYQNQDNWGKTINCYEESLEISRRLKDKHSVAKILNNLGSLYQEKGDCDKAINCYEEFLVILPRHKDEHRVAQILNNLRNLYQNQCNWDKAIDNCKKSLEIFHQLDNREKVAQTIVDLGNLYRSRGNMYQSQSNYNEAINNYNESLKIFNQLSDKQKVAQTLGDLGNLHRNEAKYEMAIDYYEKSLDIFHQLGDNHSVGKTLMNLGLIYDQCSQSEQAHEQWRKALSYLNHGSYEVVTVEQWLPRRRKRKRLKVSDFAILLASFISKLLDLFRT